MLNRQILPGLILLLTTLSALADQRSFGSMRSRDYDDRGGYYQPRHQQPVLPTRPFFVQPYPRRPAERQDHHAYRHGYQDGYGDRDSRRDSRGRGRHHGRHDDHHDSYGPHDGGYGRNQSYQQPNYYEQPNYYGPRPGASIYYNNR
jgi:hypothetical protein